ncbi:cell envelope integrity protein TolA [Anaerobutyricum hallii]|jgi:hypothetical protein|uniref:cell envelope integrity protein TolA n=1 Tax=Anaerobutyricum hallii TaxID=39488 RepID=UPI0022E5F278|nr:hypothetical protein [Anaerobutyricum hallii]
MQTENTYVETDLGNIALNPRGEYSGEASYEYLDTVSYMGGSYVCLAELTKTISRIAPEEGKNTEHWQILTLPGGLTSDYIAMHDDVVNKAKQVETSRAAVELSQQEVEDAQADVSQMRQDTQEAAEEAASSRDSAAGYAQSAEASRTAAKESEDNINAQVTGFNAYVAEKTSAAETAITEARRAAVSAVSTKQDNVTQAVTDEGDKQMKNVEDAGTEQVGKVKSAGASAVSAAGAAGVSAVNAVKAQQTASIKAVADKGTQQVTAVNTAGSTQVSTIETKGADQVKAIKEAGENAFQNISNGVDKGLSEEGKAADAKATGEAISKLTEDLSSKITKFYASNQGETHITDSDNGKIMDMMLYGKSEQKQYSGKNLLELSDNQVQSENLKIQINQGIITFSGTVNTEAFVREIDSFTVPSDGTYTISTNSNSSKDSPRILFLINDNSQYESAFNGATKKLNAGDVVRLYIRISSVGSYNGVTIKPMIEKGSEVTSYEPYTGGQPSPSPDYPQEIKSVVNPTVKVCGKNLLPFPYSDTSKTQNGVTFDVQNDGTIQIYGTASATAYFNLSTKIEWGSKSFSDTNEKYKLVGNLFYNASNKILSYVVREGATCDFILKPMVVLNTETDLTYEPYHEQTVTLPYTLNAIPVASNGNVTIDGQQYVSDYIDVERGKVVRCVKREPLSKNGRLSSSSSPFYTYNLPSAKPKTITEVFVLCNLAQFNSITTSNSQIGISSDGSNSLRMRLDGYATLEQYTRLSAEIIYELATPIEEDLTSEQIQSLQALKTKHPVTNIFITSDQLDGCTTFNYPISMANGWNYVKKQLSDNRDYIYDMDTTSAEAYVNSEYAVALTELEV